MAPDEREPIVVDGIGDAPYSKGIMAQTLMATGLSPVLAYGMAAAVGRELESASDKSLTLGALRTIARETLGETEGDEVIARYRQWQSLRRMEVPLVILIGGATGVGKSTLATEVAHRLGITRVASTDMVRQVMRAFFSIDLMPAIHYSSFEAGASVRVPVPRETDLSRAGFIEQTKAVAVGISSLIERAISEAQSLIVEGVHLVPGFLDRSRWRDALVLEFVLAVTDRELHRQHFAVRDWETGGIRPMRRYTENFPHIRRIQKYIVAQAVASDVPVIDNVRIDDAVKQTMRMTLDAVGRHMRLDEADADR
ncbi:MAG TPA: 2-phosphoglycerate kinase [Thermoleophilia bacterium]|nr:2-phosphoglycerate kinase [Thermoleophilia bacterium]HQG54854.1 2-phosphoglycerate kinase [Thermoleophilia bacterium]